MRLITLRCIFWLFILILPHGAYAGAWLQPKGESLVIGQISASQSCTIVRPDGNHISQPEYRQFTGSFYGETGVTDWLTIGFAANANDAEQQRNSAHALTEPTLFARLPVWASTTQRLSIEPVWQAPRQLSRFDGITIGNPRSEFEVALDYGESQTVFGWDSFLDARLGYRARLGAPGDQWRGQLALGTRPLPDWLALLQAFATLRSDRTNAAAFTQSGADDYDQLRIQASVVWDISSVWSLQAGLYRDMAGRNLGLSNGITLGAWRRF